MLKSLEFMKEIRDLKLKHRLLVYLESSAMYLHIKTVLLMTFYPSKLPLKARILVLKNMPKLILGVLNG
jgi:hypothetical protein